MQEKYLFILINIIPPAKKIQKISQVNMKSNIEAKI